VAAKPVKIAYVADTAELRSSLAKAEAAMQATGDTAKTAGAKVDAAFDSTAEHADTVASKGSQAAGALSGLGDLVGGKFGAAMVVGGTAMQGFADAGDLVNVITESNIVKKVKDIAVTGAHRAATVASTVATNAQAVAQRVLNAAMRANPIGLAIAAIAALAAGLVLAYQKCETFRNIVDAAFGVVKSTVAGVARFVTEKVPAAFQTVLSFLGDLPSKVTRRVSGMWDGVKNGFRDALNWIIEKWNNLSFTIPRVDLGPLGSLGGGTIDFPDIPKLAKGGIVNRPTLALIGEAGPEAVVPLNGGNTPSLGGGRVEFLLEQIVGAIDGIGEAAEQRVIRQTSRTFQEQATAVRQQGLGGRPVRYGHGSFRRP
jgi:hypothetical protein